MSTTGTPARNEPLSGMCMAENKSYPDSIALSECTVMNSIQYS